MELHHRLRRDPAWHPNSCNICGQMGHQAAQCTVGTVNWRSMYGAQSFLLRPPLFWSQIQAALKAKQIDFNELEKRAAEFAEARLSGRIPEGGAAPGAAPAQPPPPAARPPEEEGLAPGWALAKDAEGKAYYWHRETKVVTWDKPGLEPADGAAAAEEDGAADGEPDA